MAIKPHCPPHSSSACFPSSALAAIIIFALLLTLLLGLYIYHALKARHPTAQTDDEAQHDLPSPNAPHVPSTPALPHHPFPPLTAHPPTPLPFQPPASSMPPPVVPHSPRISSHTSYAVPLLYSPNPHTSQLSCSHASSTLIGSENVDPTTIASEDTDPVAPIQHQRPPLHRSLRQLTHYLLDLEARFEPEAKERTEVEVEGVFRGVEVRKLPRPERGREVRVVKVMGEREVGVVKVMGEREVRVVRGGEWRGGGLREGGREDGVRR